MGLFVLGAGLYRQTATWAPPCQASRVWRFRLWGPAQSILTFLSIISTSTYIVSSIHLFSPPSHHMFESASSFGPKSKESQLSAEFSIFLQTAVGPVMGLQTRAGTRVWVGRVRVRVDSKSPTENPHPWPGFGGFSQALGSPSHLHTTTDTTTRPGHEPEHNDAEGGRWGGGVKDEGGDGPSCSSP